jgi:hypothetical protein
MKINENKNFKKASIVRLRWYDLSIDQRKKEEKYHKDGECKQ